MKQIILLLLFLPTLLFAQYPNSGNKARLGYQTTGDGLTFRGSGAPAFSPGSLANAWMYLDTTNFILYYYKNFQWTKLPLVNNGLTFSGSYVQLGGTLVQNTQVESSGNTFDLGKISGTNKAYFTAHGSSPYYVGAYTTNGTSEMTMSIGNGVFNWQGNRSGEVMNFDGTPYGFSATYLGSFGAAQFKMDSARFRISGLSDYATHALATAGTVSNQLYRITDGRAIYINTGTGNKVSPNIWDNGTYVGILNSKPFSLGQWTTAGRPTGTNGYTGFNTTFNWNETYSVSGWFSPHQSALTGGLGTSTRAPYFDGNGRITDNANYYFSAANNALVVVGRFAHGLTSADFNIKNNNTRDGFLGIGRAFGTAGYVSFWENNQGGVRDKWHFTSAAAATPRQFTVQEATVMRIDMGFGNTNTNGFNTTVLDVSPLHNKTDLFRAKIRGIRYSPTLTSMTNVVHTGLQIDHGDVFFGTKSGSIAVGDSTVNPSSIFDVITVKRGVRPFPRMTTAKRDSIYKGVLSVAVTAGGTGYTVLNTTITTSGCNGTGAQFSPIISGSTITGVTVISQGTGFACVPSIVFTGGTGATATATLTPWPAGLIIDNSTTGQIEYWTGSAWVALTADNNGIYTGSGSLSSNTTVTGGAFDLTFNTDVTIGDSLKATTTPSHSSITGLLTRDASGWVGKARIGDGLIYAGDSLDVKNVVVVRDSAYGLKHLYSDIDIQGDYIYAASKTLSKILIYNKTNPSDTLSAFYPSNGGVNYSPRKMRVDKSKNKLYVLCDDSSTGSGKSRFFIYDITTGSSPTIFGSVDIGDGYYPSTFVVNDTLVYVHRIIETLVFGISPTGVFSTKGSILHGVYHNKIKFSDGFLFLAGTKSFTTKDTAYLQVYNTSTVVPTYVTQYKNKTLSSFNGMDVFENQIFLVTENNYVALVNFDGSTLALDKYMKIAGAEGSSYLFPYNETKGAVIKTDNTVLVASSASKYLFEFSFPEFNLISSQEIDSNIIAMDVYNNLIHMVFADSSAGTNKIVKGDLQRAIVDPTTIKEQSGIISFSAYGTPATTAAALSKTESGYVAGFATDGTVTSREIKRDTTIYVTDADYDFSAAITTAQIASRFNRVIFWMTTTAAAGSDSELTLHTPDVNLMQVEYLIHSVDEPAGFDNKIVFGTNNAVDSTNGLVTNYYPAAGDGIHIRAGLRSGVYKYRYSN